MPGAFDTWLAKPTTLRLLRRLLAADRLPVRRPPRANLRAPLGQHGAVRSSATNGSCARHWQSGLRRPDGASFVRLAPIDEELAQCRRERRLEKLRQLRNIDAWAAALADFQADRDWEGISALWKALRHRNIDLPMDGASADIMWGTLATTPELLDSVWSHALDLRSRTGTHYAHLYKVVIDHLLQIAPSDALIWHRTMSGADMIPIGAMKQVASAAIAGSRESYQAFRTLYEGSRERDLYDTVIPAALEHGEDALVLAYHRLLIIHGDGPSQRYSVDPDVRRIYRIAETALAPPVNAQISAGQPVTPAAVRGFVGDGEGDKSREVSDSFVARSIATRSISLDWVFRGLSFFSVEQLGPIAMQQLARRLETRNAFESAVRQMGEYGITPGPGVFAQLCMRLALSGPAAEWDALLASDVHPEEYDHPRTLTLLFGASESKAHGNVILSAIKLAGTRAHLEEAWNIALRQLLLARQYDQVLSCMQILVSQDIAPDAHTLSQLHWKFLPRRAEGKNVVLTDRRPGHDHLAFVTRVYMYAASRGVPVHWKLWREQVKRHGLSLRWADVQHLIIWLADHYKLEQSVARHKAKRPDLEQRARAARITRLKGSKEDPLGLILCKECQQALWHWGFRAASVRDQLRPLWSMPDLTRTFDDCEPWAQGLGLLRRLQDRGMSLDMLTLRRAFLLRMWQHFGPASSKRGTTSEARWRNHLPLVHYIKHANEIIPNLVYWVAEEVLADERSNDPRVLVEFFKTSKYGSMMPSDQPKGEYVDVVTWAEELAASESTHVQIYRKHWQRKEAFRRSPHRVQISRPGAETVDQGSMPVGEDQLMHRG